MSERHDESEPLAPLPPVDSAWALLPSAFVILALLALLLVPLAVQERLESLRTEVDVVVEPARDLTAEIQYLLARQSSALRGYLITGEAELLQRYEEFGEREREIYPELLGYAASLGDESVRGVAELQDVADEWRRLVTEIELESTPDALDPAAISEEQDLYIRTLDASTRLDLTLRSATAARAAEIQTVEGLTQGAYSILLLLALGAALAVALLNVRVRRLAAEATARSAEVGRALEETARAVEARSYLIRGFTHDVKNPLGAADGYADLLETGIRGKLSAEQTDMVRRIRRSIRGALEIIDELLDLSRLESGGLNLVRRETNLDELVRDRVRQHSVTASATGIDMQYELSDAADGAIAFTDPDRVIQIMDNLISNALKYTQAPGRVDVCVRYQSGDGAPHAGRWVLVSVKDTGPGIPPDEVERIFDEFHRVPGAPGKGHGLGLAISRGVARLLGGDVTVRSKLGEGSEFLLWIPVRENE